MLPLNARVDLGAMVIKGYSAFPKAPAILEHLHQIVLCHIRTFIRRVLPFAEMQSVYSAARVDLAKGHLFGVGGGDSYNSVEIQFVYSTALAN